MTHFFVCLLIGYLLGSIPSGYILGKILKGIDIRQYGSGNVGATNVFRVMGKIAGALALFIDIGKGIIAVVLASILIPSSFPHELGRIFVGVAAISGHNWSVFLRFKGGKGVATSLGVIFALMPQIASVLFLIWAMVVILTKYISLGSITGAICFPLLTIFSKKPFPLILFALVIGLAVIFRHSSNIRRLYRGEELKLRIKW